MFKYSGIKIKKLAAVFCLLCIIASVVFGGMLIAVSFGVVSNNEEVESALSELDDVTAQLPDEITVDGTTVEKQTAVNILTQAGTLLRSTAETLKGSGLLIGILVIVGGSFLSWLGWLIAAGFGELIENNRRMMDESASAAYMLKKEANACDNAAADEERIANAAEALLRKSREKTSDGTGDTIIVSDPVNLSKNVKDYLTDEH